MEPDEHIKNLEVQIQRLNITVEVTNERWINEVNKNMALEVELRMLKMNQGE